MKKLLFGGFLLAALLVTGGAVEAQSLTDLQIEAVSVETETRGGNAETTWKVEEGEKANDGTELDDIGITATSHSDTEGGHKGEIDVLTIDVQDDGTGRTVDIMLEETSHSEPMTKADLIHSLNEQRAVFVKLGDIKGESDGAAGASKPKEIVVVGSKVRASEASFDVFFDIDTGVVEDEDDLALHAAVLAQNDENVEEVSIQTEMISLSYKMPVRLFGIIPATMTQVAQVKADPEATDRVQVRLPWWHVLSAVEVTKEEYEEALREEIVQYDESDLEFLQRQQQTLQTISNVSKMLHDTAMAVIRKIG